MKKVQKVSVHIVQPLYNELVIRGVEPRIIRQHTGLTTEHFQHPIEYLPNSQLLALVKLAMTWLPPGYMFQLEHVIRLNECNIVGAVFMNSCTLREAIRQLIHFHSLIGEADRYEFHESHSLASLVYVSDHPDQAIPQQAEANLAILFHLVQTYSQHSLTHCTLNFCHAPPDYVKKYVSTFNSPVLFNQFENSIAFDRELLDINAPHHNPYIQNMLVSQAEQALLQLESCSQLANQVRSLLCRLLPEGKADITQVCEEAHMSRWTITRKLKDEGTTFQDLINQVKKELAIKHLLEQDVSIKEIGYMLGYSSPNSFHRAFSNWFGQSPHAYREAHMAL